MHMTTSSIQLKICTEALVKDLSKENILTATLKYFLITIDTFKQIYKEIRNSFTKQFLKNTAFKLKRSV